MTTGAQQEQVALSVEAVDYEVNGNALLKNVNCQSKMGVCTALLGANGAGKSSLLEICHGLLKPSRGRVLWFGSEVCSPRSDVGMVLQKTVFLNRSVYANLEYVLKLRGLPRKQWAQKITNVLREVRLEHKAHNHAHDLSGGEQQCLSIARVRLSAPRVILLDEPTAQLDFAACASVEKVLKDLKKEGVKIIFTTHNLAQVRRLSEEVIFLDRGKLVVCTSCEKFFDQTSLPAVADFFQP